MHPTPIDPSLDRAYEFGSFRLNSRRRLLVRGTSVVPLTSKAFDILLYLVNERERLVPKEELLERIWPDAVVEEGNLARNISTLRKALGDTREEHRYIVTVPGQGYRFVAAAVELDSGKSEPPGDGTAGVEGRTGTTDEVALSGSPAQVHSPGPSEGSEPASGDIATPAHQRVPAWDRRRTLRWARVIMLLGASGVFASLGLWSMTTGPVTGPPEIAVLPFKPLVPAGRDEAFELGLTGSVITRLSRIPGLTVTPLASVRRFAAMDQDPVEAGRSLGVRAVLESHVHRTPEGIRIMTRLLHVPGGAAVWAEEWEARGKGALDVEGRLSESVVDALGLNLAPGVRASLRRQETASREAQERFFFGKYHLGVREGSRARLAEEAFRAAIALDPQYARAYAGLAHALIAATWLDNRPAVHGMAGAKAVALEALRLDDSLAEAHAALGVVQHGFDWDHEAAEESYRRAMALDDRDWLVLFPYSTFLINRNRIDEAAAVAAGHLQLDPSSSLAHRVKATMLYVSRRYEECVVQARKALELDPRNLTAYGWLATCLEAQGRFDEVVEVMEEQRSKVRGNLEDQQKALQMRALYRAEGWQAYWTARLAERILVQQPGSPTLARIYMRIGQMDEAIRVLEQAVEERHPGVVYLNQPQWDPLRSDARFKAVLRRVGAPGVPSS